MVILLGNVFFQNSLIILSVIFSHYLKLYSFSKVMLNDQQMVNFQKVCLTLQLIALSLKDWEICSFDIVY